MERLMDHVAAHVGISRVDVRRRNLIRPQDLPYQMVIGGSIDTGDMPGVMEEALARALIISALTPVALGSMAA